MKLLTGLLAAMLLLAGVGTSHAAVRIANDRGGQIGRYVERYDQLRASGQTIMIDGLCASSCTIVLGAISHEKICVTRNANLAFHAAWDFGARGRAITNPRANHIECGHGLTTLPSLGPVANGRPSFETRLRASTGAFDLAGSRVPTIWTPCSPANDQPTPTDAPQNGRGSSSSLNIR